MANYNSDQYNNGKATGAGVGQAGSVQALIGSIEIATANVINDTITMVTAPAGFTPLYGWLVGDDLDTGTEALELDVGIAGDTTKYLNSGVVSGDTIANEKITVGIKIPLQEELMTVKPTAFTTDTDIIVTFTAAANAGGTGTLTLMLFGLYNSPQVV